MKRKTEKFILLMMLNAAGFIKRQVLLAAVVIYLCSLSIFAEESHKPLDLNGRQIIVRVYEENRQDPAAYIKKSLRIKSGRINITFTEPNEIEIVAILGEDQNDADIKRIFGRQIFGGSYQKDMYFDIPIELANNKDEDFRWTFYDALGNPVSNAKVDIYIGVEVGQQDKLALIAQSKLDDKGELTLPFCPGQPRFLFISENTISLYDTVFLHFEVSHPVYGQTVVQCRTNYADSYPHNLFIPSVPPDSEAANRSAWGILTDTHNNPIAGVLVRGSGITIPGGEIIGDPRSQECGAITDRYGKFRLYLPLAQDEHRIGTLIPPKCEYYILIKPSKELGLLSYSGRIPNGKETKITLERSIYFHTFIFEDEDGPINEPNKLGKIELYIQRPEGGKLWLKYDKIKEGGIFPLGRYEARMQVPPREYTFEPIEVTAGSTEKLVFTLKTVKTYIGQVVHGITGKPMEGVFIIDMEGSGPRNLANLTKEDWNSLHSLPPLTLYADKSFREILRRLDEYFSFYQIARTDAYGKFEIDASPKTEFYNFTIFDENYLPVKINRNETREQEKDLFVFPTIKLFPAAKIVFDFQDAEIYRRARPSIWPQLIVDANSNPAGPSEIYFSFDVPKCFYIPAEIYAQVYLCFKYNKEWSAITIAENLRLQQGQILDLGLVQLRPSVQIFARALNSAGQTVEGVAIKSVNRYGTSTSITDENGAAMFFLAQDCKGEFVVECSDNNDAQPVKRRQSIPYYVGTETDANSVYTLQLSDDILYNLFK